MKIILIIVILLFPFSLLAEEEYQDVAWERYQAGRICFEKGVSLGFEECLKVQVTCKLIYDGLVLDEKRKWLTESPKVKDYMKKTGLKPFDYLHILNLISQDHSVTKD